MEDLRQISDKLAAIIEAKQPIKAQYSVETTETREITMENGDFTLFRTLFDNKVKVDVIKDQKKGTTVGNKFDDASLQEAVDSAVTSSESASAEEFNDIAPGNDEAKFEIGVYEPDVDKLMQRAVELSDTIQKKYPKILVMQIILQHEAKHEVYRTTTGSFDETFAGNYTVLLEFAGNDGTNSTGICGSYVVTKNLDTPFIELGNMEKDLKDAEASLNPISVEGKFEGNVIFTPACAAQMMAFSFSLFAGDGGIIDNSSLWKDKMNQKVAADCLTVSMKPWDERIVSHEVHTADGFRSEDYTLIDKGELRSFMTSLYTANKCNVNRAKNTGFDVVVEAGDISFEDMVKNTKKGLIVGSISCGHPGANGEISGVAKNSFYVEDGQIKGAVMETMVSFNLAEMFLNIKEISKELVCDGAMVMPYFNVDHIIVSGK